MKKYGLKIIISLFLIITMLTIYSPILSYAMDREYMRPDQFDGYNTAADYHIAGGENGNIGYLIKKTFSVVLAVVRTIAVSWAILMMFFMAIKYFTGNSKIKAQLKTDIPTYALGAVLLFGSAGLLTIIKYIIEEYF